MNWVKFFAHLASSALTLVATVVIVIATVAIATETNVDAGMLLLFVGGVLLLGSAAIDARTGR